VLVFSSDGKLLQQLRIGDAATEEVQSPASIALDQLGNIFVYDRVGRRVTVLQQPTYHATRTFQLLTPVTVFLALDDGGVVTYFPNGREVFIKHNRDGKRVSGAGIDIDERLRIFHGRVQTGGIAPLRSGEFFAMHPASYQLLHLSRDLRIVETLRYPENDQWAPQPPRFPEGLDPYDYKRAHETWWNSFIHIGRLHALTDSLLLLTLFKSDGLWNAEEFVNVYRVTGEVVWQGLRVPRGGRVIGAAYGRVYVGENARLEGDTLTTVKLHEYAIRHPLD